MPRSFMRACGLHAGEAACVRTRAACGAGCAQDCWDWPFHRRPWHLSGRTFERARSPLPHAPQSLTEEGQRVEEELQEAEAKNRLYGLLLERTRREHMAIDQLVRPGRVPLGAAGGAAAPGSRRSAGLLCVGPPRRPRFALAVRQGSRSLATLGLRAPILHQTAAPARLPGARQAGVQAQLPGRPPQPGGALQRNARREGAGGARPGKGGGGLSAAALATQLGRGALTGRAGLAGPRP